MAQRLKPRLKAAQVATRPACAGLGADRASAQADVVGRRPFSREFIRRATLALSRRRPL
jgi:hypothetical protein